MIDQEFMMCKIERLPNSPDGNIVLDILLLDFFFSLADTADSGKEVIRTLTRTSGYFRSVQLTVSVFHIS